MPSLASVVLPVSVDREFTYLVPPDMESAVTPGVRVLVPFGPRWVIGLVVDRPASTTVASLKPIRDVVDAQPAMPAELLHLCRWIASYYLAPLGEVLRAAIPHGFSVSGKKIVRPSATLTAEIIGEIQRSSPKRSALLHTVLAQGAVKTTDLQKSTGFKTFHTVLSDLVREGLVIVDEMAPQPKVRSRHQEFLLPETVDEARAATVREQTPSRKRNLLKLLDGLLEAKRRGDQEIATAQFLKHVGVPASALRELVNKDVVRTEQRNVMHSADYGTEEQTRHIVLNPAQRTVLDAIAGALGEHTPVTFLLHGVTGSGKTQVYIEAIRTCIDAGNDAIVLVPEISLTPQIVRRFKTHFGDAVGVVHSRMTPRERHDVWTLARAGTIKVVIGPRSAVFAPLKSLALVVVDEEHESSYKQYDAVPRYHARDVAIVRGNLNNAVVVLGSATPSAESFQNAVSGKYRLVTLPERVDAVPMPAITIVDMTQERKARYAEWKASLRKEQKGSPPAFQHSSLSLMLREKIADRITRKEGIILLQNRRGFAPVVECPDCGFTERCELCNVSMTYHLSHHHLRCHYCGSVRQPRKECPQCGGTGIRMLGAGTQRVEQDLGREFPQATIVRMDLDTTSRKGAHARILRQFEHREADILLGTQMVAKGLDFPHVTLVGVISADTQMLLPDFRANERTFQILTQVAGRAGRSTLKGEVIIQTAQPDHFSLKHVVDHDYRSFIEEELEARKELSYPPYSRLILVEWKGRKEETVRARAEAAGTALRPMTGPFMLLGPAPALIDKINNEYRWHLILKCLRENDPNGSRTRAILGSVLASQGTRHRGLKVIVDMDPIGMM